MYGSTYAGQFAQDRRFIRRFLILLDSMSGGDSLGRNAGATWAEALQAHEAQAFGSGMALLDATIASERFPAGQLGVPIIDAAGAQDAALWAAARAFADGIATGDGILYLPGLFLHEGLEASERQALILTVAVHDVVFSQDRGDDRPLVTLSESAGAAEAFRQALTVALTDGAGITDVTSYDAMIALHEALTAQDRKAIAAAISLAETLSSADRIALARALFFLETLTGHETLVPDVAFEQKDGLALLDLWGVSVQARLTEALAILEQALNSRPLAARTLCLLIATAGLRIAHGETEYEIKQLPEDLKVQ